MIATKAHVTCIFRGFVYAQVRMFLVHGFHLELFASASVLLLVSSFV